MAAKLDRLLERAAALAESDTGEAQRLLEKAVALAPDQPRVHRRLIETLLRRSDFAAARAAAERGLRRWPAWANGTAMLATALYFQGDLKGARDALTSLPQADRTQEHLLNLGLIHHALGANDTALNVLHRALAMGAGLGPGEQTRAWVALMRLHRDMGNRSEAEDAAMAALRLYPQKPVWTASTVSRLVNRRDFPEWDRFRKKDGFARALAAAPPGTAPRHPATYLLPDEHERLMADAAAGRSGPVWIVKEPDLFGGQGMALTSDPAALAGGPPRVAQHYIGDPLLIEGHKGHLRCYLLITCADPLRGWLWRDGLVRLAPEPYRPGPEHLGRADMHITNTALHTGHPGIRFHQDRRVETFGSVRGLAATLRQIVPQESAREALWQEIGATARRFLAVQEADGFWQRHAAGRRAFLPKLIGMDILLDRALRPWLIEIQRVPGQTGDGPVNTVNARMFRQVFEMTVGPLGPEGDIDAAEAAHERAHAADFMPV